MTARAQFRITDIHGRTAYANDVTDLYAKVKDVKNLEGMDGGIGVGGTYAIGYHSNLQHKGCGGHLIARVYDIEWEMAR